MVVTIDDNEVHHLSVLIEHDFRGMSVARAVAIKQAQGRSENLTGFAPVTNMLSSWCLPMLQLARFPAVRGSERAVQGDEGE